MLKKAPSSQPEPWDVETELLVNVSDQPLDRVREAVILRWLQEGDLRPLRAALIKGNNPGRVVLGYLGAMMLGDDAEYCLLDDLEGRQTPRQIVTRQRCGGHPRQQAQNWLRDLNLAAEVMARIKLGSPVAEAIDTVAETSGKGMSLVKQVYQKYRIPLEDI